MSLKNLLLKDFKLPKLTLFELIDEDENHGQFTIAPLERGFGITIANLIRKILLFSLDGYAITAMRIEYMMEYFLAEKIEKKIKLNNPFQPIAGFDDETLDFIQNLKLVELKLLNDIEIEKITIEKKGPYILTAKDIEDANPSVKVYNPDLYIATLNEKADIKIELQIELGKGYVAAEQHFNFKNEEKSGYDVIPIDAIFTPIRKIEYNIENYRVGQRTDYDKIILDVWSNKTTAPDDAVKQAAALLKKYFGTLLEEGIEQEGKYIAELEEQNELYDQEDEDDNQLQIPLEELEFTIRTISCLKSADIKKINQLLQKTEGELSQIKHLGKKSLIEIKEKLEPLGFSLKKANNSKNFF